MPDLGMSGRKMIAGTGSGAYRLATPFSPAVGPGPPVAPNCTSDTAPVLIGSFGGSESYPFDDIAVNPARDILYALNRTEGLYRFTYPGLVNIDGAGTLWKTETAGEDWRGLAIDPSGNVYLSSITTAGPPHNETIYQVTPAGTKSLWATRSRVLNGDLTSYTLAWSPVDGTVWGKGRGAGLSGQWIVQATSGGTITDIVATGSSGPVAIGPVVTPDGAVWWLENSGTIQAHRYAGSDVATTLTIDTVFIPHTIAGQPDSSIVCVAGPTVNTHTGTGVTFDTAVVEALDPRLDGLGDSSAHSSLDGQYATFNTTGAGRNDDIYELHTCP